MPLTSALVAITHGAPTPKRPPPPPPVLRVAAEEDVEESPHGGTPGPTSRTHSRTMRRVPPHRLAICAARLGRTHRRTRWSA
jgi:hypothetical protein